ncbi:Hypothetical predicted protein [Octopus vulgaris]|uniref:Uncharacterized protein n=1 Tax=Octopus vulgaris TaxID=6645 RepID=A0AA36FET8_OCTVU|nr:Hypothetical predicted protein [Octopus vulgaris]
MIRERAPELDCNHDEGATRVVPHVLHMAQDYEGIVIRASDTDITVIMLYHLEKAKAAVWMEVGTSGQNTRRYVNLSQIAASIGPLMCKALPGFHIFTGCDYTSSFDRQGKIRPLQILEENTEFQYAFAKLGDADPDLETFTVIEKYTCRIYRQTSCTSINDARYAVFEKEFFPCVKAKDPLEKLKGIDASSLPQCHNGLL